ncbi:MAG: hypothetical protein IKV25_06940 [Clostridia bacterium]|nr:hypothetical protein [Clostridia bacterium]
MYKKITAIVMAMALMFSVFAMSTSACFDNSAKSVNTENYINQLLDDVIHKALKVFNLVWPGYDKNWDSKDDYIATDFYAGEESFNNQIANGAKWSLGYAGASLLEDMDIMNGEYFLAGSLEPFAGRVPTKINDDQRVRVYAISDGVSGIVIQAVIDGFGFSRGDVQKIRSRMNDFAEANGYNIISVNVSVLHQHSCIDTLGMNVPLLSALVLNTTNAALGGLLDDYKVTKNQQFMENLFDKTVECMQTAVESMEDGNLYYGSADIEEYMRDARDPIAFDSNIHRLRFVPENGGKETWILQGSMHATGMGAGPDELTADYPYYIEKAINEKANANVVYVLGAELAIKMDKDLTNTPDATDIENIANYGYAVAEKVMTINNDILLNPVLNVAHREVFLPVDNGILTLAAREDLFDTVIVKDGLGKYVMVTEIGYMELGNKVGIFLCPGEFDPSIIFGGPESGDAAWTGETWDYAPLKDVANVEYVMVYGLCNDQAGYVLRDNEYHSLLSENEEVNIVNKKSGSIFTQEYINLINEVK